MSQAQVTREQLFIIRAALNGADEQCRFHGTNFDLSDPWHHGPRCESCRQPYRITQARAVLEDLDRLAQ